MTAGLGVLRIEPSAFWAMTPRELAAALRSLPGMTPTAAPLARADLDALTQRFPDEPEGGQTPRRDS